MLSGYSIQRIEACHWYDETPVRFPNWLQSCPASGTRHIGQRRVFTGGYRRGDDLFREFRAFRRSACGANSFSLRVAGRGILGAALDSLCGVRCNPCAKMSSRSLEMVDLANVECFSRLGVLVRPHPLAQLSPCLAKGLECLLSKTFLVGPLYSEGQIRGKSMSLCY